MSGYVPYHSIGTFPGKVEALRDAFGRFADRWSAEDDGQWPAARELRGEFLEAWRRLIRVPEGSMACRESVTAGLHALVGALPRARLAGRRMLVGADCFPKPALPAGGLGAPLRLHAAHRADARGRALGPRRGHAGRLGPDVGLALLTLVISTASYRRDLAALAAHGRAQGSLVVLDATRGAGIVPLSLEDVVVDAVVSTSLNWLGGVPGAGVLQVARPSSRIAIRRFAAGSARRTPSPGPSTPSATRQTPAGSTRARPRSCRRQAPCRACASSNAAVSIGRPRAIDA